MQNWVINGNLKQQIHILSN